MGSGSRFRVIASLALLLIIGFSGTCSACNASQIAEFRQKNIPDVEIRKLCGLSADTPIPDKPPTGSTCYVKGGSCPLSGSAATGAACWCNTPFGTAQPGEIR